MWNRKNLFSDWECRTKLIAAFVWVIGILFIERLDILCLLILVLLLLFGVEEDIAFSLVTHRLRHVSPFVILMAVTLSLSGGIPLEREAVVFAALVCLRVLVAALVMIALAGAEDVDRFISSLASIGLPNSYVTIMFLTNRYIKLFMEDFQQQKAVLKSRMFTPKSDPYTLKNIGYIVGGMFIKAYDRSEHVYRAMKARSFCGVIAYEEPRPVRGTDVGKLAAAALLMGAAIAAGYLVP